ncbi:RNA polymerase sigma factor [Amycolatopsis albispora]|uniref:RNA polymerase sigma factor n=1 Tax=Amycolatopsis albispora TaxID=1804986 RepID=UPI0013B3C4A7|nr:RNA polymerase sigma factor [Amycolatopsis albispora]
MDDAEFDRIFLEVLHRLYSRVSLLVGGRHLADDLVQEVYVRLKARASRRRRFVEHPNPYGYALATAMNLARGQWRSARRATALDRIEESSDDGGLAAFESWEAVSHVLQSLTGKEAVVVLLVDLDGHSIDEAAQLLGVHKGTAQRNRTRALAKLREALASPALGADGGAR